MKSGTMVRVKNNLEISYRKYGPSDTMEKMKGYIFPIKETFSEDGVVIAHEGFEFSFSKQDLIDTSTEKIKVKKIKPATFDPDYLDL